MADRDLVSKVYHARSVFFRLLSPPRFSNIPLSGCLQQKLRQHWRFAVFRYQSPLLPMMSHFNRRRLAFSLVLVCKWWKMLVITSGTMVGQGRYALEQKK